MDRQPRHELKYFISVADAPKLRGLLERVLHRDSHGDSRNSYQIRSLYFDDAYDSAYQDKVNGVMHRDKYRIRVYGNDENAIYLERKRKLGDLIAKDAQPITRRLAEQIVGGVPRGLERLEPPLFHDLFMQMRLHLLKPVVVVDYDRQAYVHPVQHVRVTFDRQVRSGAPGLDLFDPHALTVPVLDPGTMILEVKYDTYLPDFIPPILSTIPAQRSAISKYTLCRRYA